MGKTSEECIEEAIISLENSLKAYKSKNSSRQIANLDSALFNINRAYYLIMHEEDENIQ